MTMTRDRRGFTLTEMLIVVLIMGMLAALAIPSYLKTQEAQWAEDAVAMTNMVGTTNRMFALDHGGSYIAADAFPASTCAAEGMPACPVGAGSYSNACILVACKYLPDADWNGKKYTFYTCDGSTNGTACGTASAGSYYLSSSDRKSGTYTAWGYSMNTSGVITKLDAGAPDPTY